MKREISTPFLWFSQPVDGAPKPWKHFGIDGLMVNAYEILQRKSTDEAVREKGIHRYLAFEGPIAMDSGGFLFMKKKSLNVDPQRILELYELGKPDLGVVLDHPLQPNLPSVERKRRQMKSLKNTRDMVTSKRSSNPELIPVIHGHSPQTVSWYIRVLKRISDFETYGIGSLVPSVFNTKGAGGIYNVLKIVSYVKKKVPDKRIHVFGIGSTLTMHLMFYVGADSVDSSGWRTKAAFGAIQLSGVGDRYITPRKRHKIYPNLSSVEKELLAECRCPICRKEGLKELRKSFEARALHNSWVYQKEIEKTRELIKEGEYEDYLQKILTRSALSNAFKYAVKLEPCN
jgi:7-cyano-7-deazaguanine tRNA-ribosyltransferase